MAELVTDDITWKKGETGIQKAHIYQSDGIARKDITGIALTFKMWAQGASSNKATASLTITSAANGETQFTVSSAMTDTIGDYLGEIVGDDGEKTDTFNVKIKGGTAPA